VNRAWLDFQKWHGVKISLTAIDDHGAYFVKNQSFAMNWSMWPASREKVGTQ
jgi:hypothetical protein